VASFGDDLVAVPVQLNFRRTGRTEKSNHRHAERARHVQAERVSGDHGGASSDERSELPEGPVMTGCDDTRRESGEHFAHQFPFKRAAYLLNLHGQLPGKWRQSPLSILSIADSLRIIRLPAVAALCAGLLLMFAGVPLLAWVTIFGALVAAGVELLPLRINDNLVIPIVSGGVMELAGRMAQ
jgi:hypothetical protein